ncbi:DUF2931 family protein [Vibrio sp. TRT 2004]|uniref:DUF2931 family protein n=1 Tax=Vibrio sp. TRT 2004 TaxID=3418506 RepID=UPI003CF3BE8D
MKWFIALLGLIAFTNTHAFSRVPSVPEDMPKWRVGYAMPTLYPVKVKQAYGVNEQQNWTSFVHNDQQYMFRTDYAYIKQSYPDYDGFGVPLGAPIGYSTQISGTNTLPDSIYIFWTSISTQTFYTTKWDLTQKVKKIMSTKDQYTRRDGFNKKCYRVETIFGFLPNGNSKVWLRGCGEYIYISELAPIAQQKLDIPKNTDGSFKNVYVERVIERAKQLGATLDPIPWDKVNKVYSTEKITKLEL